MNTKCTSPQTGSALVMAIFVLVLMAGIGTTLLFLSQSELEMSRAGSDSAQSFYLAEAAIEHGRRELFLTNGTSPDFSLDLARVFGDDDTLGFDRTQVRAQFDSTGHVTGITGFSDDQPIAGVTSFGSGMYAAFLTNDPEEGRGNPTDGDGRVMLTGIGAAPNGSLEIVEAVIEPQFLLPVIPPAAMTILGPSPIYDNGNSSAQSNTGQDCPGGGGQPGLYVPTVGTIGPGAASDVESQMNRPESFTSGTLSGTATVADLTDSSDPAVQQSAGTLGDGTIEDLWTDCNYLKTLVQELIGKASYYCNRDNGPCVLPQGANREIVVVDGDVDIGSFEAGTLLVTGDLTYSGADAWDGIVLVVGEGSLTRNGGGNGQNSGAMILANVDPSPAGARSDKSDWCTGGDANGFGSASFEVNGAGTSSISFCSTTTQNNNPAQTYKVIEFAQY